MNAWVAWVAWVVRARGWCSSMHVQPEQPHRLFVGDATHCKWHWWMVLTFGKCFDVWSSRIGTNLSVERRGVAKKSASVEAYHSSPGRCSVLVWLRRVCCASDMPMQCCADPYVQGRLRSQPVATKIFLTTCFLWLLFLFFSSSEYRTMADRVGAVRVHSRASEDERSREDSAGALLTRPRYCFDFVEEKKGCCRGRHASDTFALHLHGRCLLTAHFAVPRRPQPALGVAVCLMRRITLHCSFLATIFCAAGGLVHCL